MKKMMTKKNEHEKRDIGGNEGGYDDIEFDEVDAIHSIYLGHYKFSKEKSIKECMRVFNKTEEEIKQIIAEDYELLRL